MVCKWYDLRQLLLETQKTKIVSFDTEGAPATITQASMVDADGKELMNRYIRGKMSAAVVKQFTGVLGKIKILIGYNISADVRALEQKKIHLPSQVLIVDVYETFMYLLRNKMVKTQPKSNCLGDVAKIYGITEVAGYHNSLVDATVTMRLFWEMNKQTDGKFIILEQEQIPELVPENAQKEGEYDMPNVKEYMDYSYQQEETIHPISKHIYEAVVDMYGTKVIVRLTKGEYKLFLKIRKVTPDYPLWVFYRTIVAPGVIRREKEYAEKDRKKVDEEAELLVVDALN